MKKIEVFIQSEGRRAVEVVEVPASGTVRDLLTAAREKGIEVEEADLLVEDAEDALDATLSLSEAGIGARTNVHVGRRRRIAVTVQFEGDALRHPFAPAQRVKHVLKRATKHFEISPADAKEYALQVCGTDDRPELDTHLGALVCGPEAALCFDLILKRRVQG
jgi:hypothetical protein